MKRLKQALNSFIGCDVKSRILLSGGYEKLLSLPDQRSSAKCRNNLGIKGVTESCCNSYSEFRSKWQKLLVDEGNKQCSNLVNVDKWRFIVVVAEYGSVTRPVPW